MANRLGNTIRRRRRQLSLTQEQLGERVGKSQVAVSEWERGVAHPSDVSGLARALEMSQEELAMAAAAGALDADDVAAAILEQTRLPMDVRLSLVKVYKAVLNGYGPEPELAQAATSVVHRSGVTSQGKNVPPDGATLPP